ncbi:hypothetical protein SDC9_138498 [bioreactor metagenome]|uniref:Uncharacterized protein n=1 Tax=bioreactor metagenome TaxID=1076179 RepID=A0A645DPF4_9ZZZZ
MENPVGRVPHAARHTDGAVVPQIPANFAYDHGDPVGGEAHRLGDIKIIDGLNQTHAAHLKQIVRVFAPVGELLDDGEHQPEISLDESLSRLPVALLCPAQEFHGFLILKDLQLGCVYPANLDLSLHESHLVT